MFTTRIAVASAAAGACVLVTSACTTSGTDDSPTTASSARSSGSTSQSGAPDFPSTSATSKTATAPPPSSGNGSLSAALLTAADVKGFKAGKVDDSSSPLPCTPNAPSLEKQAPPQDKADATLVSDTGQSLFKEGIYAFVTAAKAQAFVADGAKGFDCTNGNLGPLKAKIVGPYKPKITSASDQNLAWDAALSDGSFATLSLTRVGDKVIGLVFQATKAGQHEIAPPKVIELAVEKLAASG